MANGTADSWERIQSILEIALEREPGEVAAYLDEACSGDAVLRGEVESLIAADRRAPAFLDRRTLLLSDPPAIPVPLENARLGAFRVLHEIGRGGMSVVYLGERADAQFVQRVAVKVLQQDARAAGMAERFRMERQILGSLDHRGIVRILDGGTTGDGRPYLVMEHIEGERIDTWCDRHRLTIEQRLSLFGQVLHAVAYAHRALVVHRDLKPDNILVTEDGEVRLLDFGIAKLLDRGSSTNVTLTRAGLRAMTPEYASPEQIRGEHVTTASDIYALGVLLFQILTGQRPYALEEQTPWAVERAVLESEPDRPSTAIYRSDKPGDTADARAAARRTEPGRLHTMLDGDLDAIVLKALRKEPGERYGSADAFREDIERYLGSQPVLARRGTRWYRARKFARRHRAGVAVGAAGAVVLLGSTAAIASSRNVAETARESAEREARTAREVTDFLIAVFGGSNPFSAVGDTVSARTLLEQGRERIGRELHDAPLVRASLLDAMGQVYTGLGRFETADSLLLQALELRTQVLGPDDVAIAESFRALGRNRSRWRDYPSALSHFERAAAILGPRTAELDVGRQAGFLTDLVTPLRELGQVDSAYALVQRAIALDLASGDTLSVGHLNRRVELAMVLRAREEFDAASRIYADLLPAIERTVGESDPLYSVH
jgi:eukaryotic-like serine/threonine-protein kinase